MYDARRRASVSRGSAPDDPASLYATLVLSEGWEAFLLSFEAILNRKEPLSTFEKNCLITIFSNGKPGNTINLSKEEFGLALKRFGPLTLFLKKIESILVEGKVWFHGDADGADSIRRLQTQPNNAKMFLIRYSSRSPGAFSVSYVTSSGEVKIFNGLNNNAEGEGLILAVGEQVLTYSNFTSFLQANSKMFDKPCSMDPADSFQKMKEAIHSPSLLLPGKDAPVTSARPTAPRGTVIDHVDNSESCRQIVAEAISKISFGLLDVANKNLKGLPSPDMLSAVDSLTEFDASSNLLPGLPLNFGKTLSGLTKIDLSNNKLTQLSPCFGSMRKLGELNLSRNDFAIMPNEIAELSSLEILEISHNSIQSIPPAFFEGLVALLKVDMSFNNISSIPPSIISCTLLNSLELGHNRLSKLPNELTTLERLRAIDVSANGLVEIHPSFLGLLQQLTKFEVADNPLRSPPHEMAVCGIPHIIAFLKGSPLPIESRPTSMAASSGFASTPALSKSSDKPQLERSKGLKSFKDATPGDSTNGERKESGGNLLSRGYSGNLNPLNSRGIGGSSSTSSSASQNSSSNQSRAMPSSGKKDIWDKLKKQTINDFFLLDQDREVIKKRHETDYLIAILHDSTEEKRRAISVAGPTRGGSVEQSDLIAPTPDFSIEYGTISSTNSSQRLRLEINSELDCTIYCDYFMRKMHANVIGKDKTLGAVALSVCKEPDIAGNGSQFYRALVRTAECDSVYDIPATAVQRKSKKATAHTKYVVKALQETVPSLAKTKFRTVRTETSINDYKHLEQMLRMPRCFRFGVLYAKNGQSSEAEMYDNAVGSPAYHHFLEFLGQRITLRGWTKHKAGLDVKRDSTGKESYYTVFRDYEIMYHCSTLLPYLSNDPQRLERKRHIGNDVVVIIFKDTKRGEPSLPMALSFQSHMTHVYVVVEVDHSKSTPDQIYYKVNIARKKGISVSEPTLPEPPIFAGGASFQEFFLTKLINLERAACAEGIELKMANRRKRRAVLDELEKKIPKEKKGKKATYYNDPDLSSLKDMPLADSRKNFEENASNYHKVFFN